MLDEKSLIKYFESADLPLDTQTAARLCGYAQMLIEKNKVMNLTAITDDEGIAIKHFADSILPLTLVDFPQNAKIADVGTGAGFPGIPMCIYRNDFRPVLIDSLKKRVNFLEEVCEKYLPDAVCVHSRAEDAGRAEEYREQFDAVVARAVARLNLLCEYCLPFVKKGGIFVALKGPDLSEEARLAEKAVKMLGARIEKIIPYTLPNGEGRTVAVIRKISDTPKKFPRQSAKIAKHPL